MRRIDRVWTVKDTDGAAVERLMNEFKLREPIVRALTHRGILDAENARRFLSATLIELPDPFLLKGMAAATARIEKAIRRGEKILIWGDYDVDGITSTALLIRFFERIQVKVEHSIPRRHEEGYGLNLSAVEEMARQKVTLLITVDNGITSVTEIARAKELGLDTIVVDHHQLDETLPPAVAIINPKQPDCAFPEKDSAAVGLTFMLLAGMRRHLVTCGLLSRDGAPKLKDYLDLVALGTIADLVPLLGLNRLFVREGLPLLSKTHRPGLLALKEVSRIDVDQDVDSYSVGFMLAPRINAGGRLGDALAGVKLLTTESLTEARIQADYLNKNNISRRSLETVVLDQAMELIRSHPDWTEAPALVLAGEGWNEGIVGLVASRLTELFYRPSIVIGINSEGMGRGSCRSIPALHMQQTLQELSGHLVRFGGHSQAAGLSIRADAVEAFRKEFIHLVGQKLKAEDFVPKLETDGECPLDTIDYTFLDELERLAPFGMANRAPVYIARDEQITPLTLIKEKHWKLGLAAKGSSRVLDGIAFNQAHHALSRGDRLDIAFIPEYNTFKGTRSIQLQVVDLHRVG